MSDAIATILGAGFAFSPSEIEASKAWWNESAEEGESIGAFLERMGLLVDDGGDHLERALEGFVDVVDFNIYVKQGAHQLLAERGASHKTLEMQLVDDFFDQGPVTEPATQPAGRSGAGSLEGLLSILSANCAMILNESGEIVGEAGSLDEVGGDKVHEYLATSIGQWKQLHREEFSNDTFISLATAADLHIALALDSQGRSMAALFKGVSVPPHARTLMAAFLAE